MTRIGKVTIKFEDAKAYAPTVIQEITENGKAARAAFQFERAVCHPADRKLYPGSIVRLTHFQYRRVPFSSLT